MRKGRFLLGMISMLLLLGVSVFAEEDKAQNLIGKFQEETKCREVSAVIYQNGKGETYGDTEGLFQIGSMTKAFTGLAMQKLIHEGKVKGEDLVSEYLTGFEAFYDGKAARISIDQLMTQKSGFTNEESKYPSAKDGETLAEWAMGISGKNLQAAPGERYAYSNVNYNLLGAIIERVTGESYKEYVEREILTPLGLTHTYVGMSEEAGKEIGIGENGVSELHVVEGSRLLFRGVIPFSLPVREGAIPAGYFYSNAKDMERWMEVWMGIADVPEEFGGIMQEIYDRLREEGDYYAGWECFGKDRIGHSGGTPNYSSRIVFSKEERIGACVLTNLNVAASTDSLCNGLYDLARGQEPGGIVTDVWTIFDQIFTALCILGAICIVICIWSKKRGILIVLGVMSLVLASALAIVLPLIFGAGLFAILFTWAPWSLTVFFGALATSAVTAGFRWRKMGKDENNKKASEGAAAHGDH